MKVYKLSQENYELLKTLDLSEMKDSILFNDANKTIETNNIRLLQIILTEEIAVKGMHKGQEQCNDYGRQLYSLYDELYYQ